MKSYIYAASPYSDPNPAVRQMRFEQVSNIVGDLIKKGWIIYSPIMHNHAIAVSHDLPRDIDFWMRLDTTMLAHASAMMIVTMPGWASSKGIALEMKFAKENQIPVFSYFPNE